MLCFVLLAKDADDLFRIKRTTVIIGINCSVIGQKPSECLFVTRTPFPQNCYANDQRSFRSLADLLFLLLFRFHHN